jgi:hypothetical protein
MQSELKELATVVAYTLGGFSACERIQAGVVVFQRISATCFSRGCVATLTCCPARTRSCYCLTVISPENRLTFTVTPLGGLDGIWVLFVSDKWWTLIREKREEEFVQNLLISLLARRESGARGGPHSREGGHKYGGDQLERRLKIRVGALLRRGR